jgi:hypothetical protein
MSRHAHTVILNVVKDLGTRAGVSSQPILKRFSPDFVISTIAEKSLMYQQVITKSTKTFKVNNSRAVILEL